jgi:hypothetical protein
MWQFHGSESGVSPEGVSVASPKEVRERAKAPGG